MNYSQAVKTNINTIPKEGKNEQKSNQTNKKQINWAENINKKLPDNLISPTSQTLIKQAWLLQCQTLSFT